MSRYFKICLLSPIWFPFALCGLLMLLQPLLGQDDAFVEWLKGLCFFTVAALVFGGVQYMIALVLVWRRIDFDSLESIVIGCVALPIVFTPIQVLVFAMFIIRSGWSGLEGIFGLAGMDLMFGYMYVIVWFIGYWLFTLFRKLRGWKVHYG